MGTAQAFQIYPSSNNAQSTPLASLADYTANKDYKIEAKNTDTTYLALKAIEEIPNSVIAQGEPVANKWIQDYINSYLSSSSQTGRYQYQRFNVLGCVSAAGVALASNAIPLAKITKLKAFFKSVGGVKTFISTYMQVAKKLKNAGYQGADLVKRAVSLASAQAGPEVQEALLSFFSIGSIIAACQ